MSFFDGSAQLEALETTIPFDEAEALRACERSLLAELNLATLEVRKWPPPSDLAAAWQPKVAKLQPPTPGHPACLFV